MKLDILRRLNEARARRAATVLLTDITSGEERLVVESDGYAGDPLREEISARFRSGASGMGPAGGPAAGTFFTVHLPPPRLVVIGAAHASSGTRARRYRSSRATRRASAQDRRSSDRA
jgi:xanthine dehydrogenase accessory factor